MKNRVRNIGQAGIQTSFIVKTTHLKSILKGGSTCQENIDTEIDNPNSKAWLQLNQTLQNIKGKAIATIAGNIDSKEVLVKVQLVENANKEYAIQQTLKKNGMSGFIDFKCIFTCAGDREYIESFSLFNDSSRLCKAKGVSMGGIVMPYYKNKSFEDFLRTYNGQNKKDKVKRILCRVIENAFAAYNILNFTHGDLFTKNIVLSDEFEPIIIDFEKCSFQANLNRFWLDIDNFINDVSRYMSLHAALDDVTRQHVVMNRATVKEPDYHIVSQLCIAIMKI